VYEFGIGNKALSTADLNFGKIDSRDIESLCEKLRGGQTTATANIENR